MRNKFTLPVVSAWLRRLGFDSSLAYALGARAWQGLSGLMTLWLVIHCMLPAEQGFYYTFSGILNVQLFFELGLSFVIVQLTPHYFTKLTWGERGELIGSVEDKNHLASFLNKSVLGYVGTSLCYALFVMPMGYYFFSTRQHEVVNFVWQLPWVCVVAGTALNLMLSPFFAAIEGSGRVTDIYRFRTKQFICSSIMAWVVLCCGQGLWMAVASVWVNVALSALWLYTTNPKFIAFVIKKPLARTAFSWRKEVWSMQWRIAISWMSGYFIAQIFTPLLFYYQGTVVSGQMGVSLTLLNLLSLLCLTWISVRSPTMGRLVANRDWRRLDHLFTTIFWQSISAFVFGAVVLMLGIYVCQHTVFIERLLPWPQLLMLLASMLCAHMVGAWSLYLRAHKTDPFMPLSIVGAVLLGCGSWYGAKYAGSIGVCWSLLLVNVVYGLPSGYWLWTTHRVRWHQQEECLDGMSVNH